MSRARLVLVEDATGRLLEERRVPLADAALQIAPDGATFRAAGEDVDLARDIWDGAAFVADPSPPAPPIRALSRVQFLLVAASVGYSEAQIEALIAADTALTEDERKGLLIRFRGAQLFPRDWPGLEAIAADAGLMSAQIDDLYRYGATL